MDIKINALVASSILFFCCSASATVTCKQTGTAQLFTDSAHTNPLTFEITNTNNTKYTISSDSIKFTATLLCYSINTKNFHCDPDNVKVSGKPIFAILTNIYNTKVQGEANSWDIFSLSKSESADNDYTFQVQGTTDDNTFNTSFECTVLQN